MAGGYKTNHVKGTMLVDYAALLSTHGLNMSRYETINIIGVSVYPAHGNDLTQLLKNADDAMYEVKKNGKSGYRVVTV